MYAAELGFYNMRFRNTTLGLGKGVIRSSFRFDIFKVFSEVPGLPRIFKLPTFLFQREDRTYTTTQHTAAAGGSAL